jgi:hypothetical protein
MIKVYEVQKRVSRLCCPKCEKEMTNTGRVDFVSTPIRYQYACYDCSLTLDSILKFPLVSHEEIPLA